VILIIVVPFFCRWKQDHHTQDITISEA